ncbi:RimK family protein [Noviherbaspirillum saxi]|uniref:RimK family alpha-L-glutamate ligase n=1 Tax=Noviherbaspirillum saxi TaxID=2320863 RepID=A0A3A3FS92_9BURK|nr:RimK family protein [Noviherbaspirillum saxi]RJF99087.1 RimK family alpha-L-glutamate ligase [Noviherbaspirillum saxi]
MNILFVVSREQDWPNDIPGVTVIPAQTYLMDPAYGDMRSTKVFNLCRTYRYQSKGYYVSLLAEARGHRPLPDAEAMKDLHSETLVQDVSDRLGNLIDCSFSRTTEDVVDLNIYFGRDADGLHQHLSEQLFKLLRTPVLHARFERANGQWHLCSIHAGSVYDIPAHQQELATQAVIEHLKEQKIHTSTASRKPLLAILHDPTRSETPSNPEAIRKFIDAAELLGMSGEVITPKDTRRLTEFDALFIRDTTNVDHYTYQISRQATAAGMVVIDDPDSILRCTNKIYLDELLTRHHIPTPRTMVVHQGNVDKIVAKLGLPCILKQPDGAFSLGVVKIESEQDLLVKVNELLQQSELVLAQEYLPTQFDWRIGVFDQRALFVCKYYMAPGHWQIIKHERHRTSEGRTEALSVGEAPDDVVKIALQAANLIGDGFYGVDLKQIGAQYYVIEINDNPNVDAGNEDAVLGDALYREVMGVFRKRIDSRKGNTTP